MSTFHTTQFYLSQWANKQEEEEIPSGNERPVILNVVESEFSRKVCEGNDCTLYYDSSSDEYQELGGCQRGSFCTETRILKDQLFVSRGSYSETLNCVDNASQLKFW